MIYMRVPWFNIEIKITSLHLQHQDEEIVTGFVDENVQRRRKQTCDVPQFRQLS